MKKHKLSLTVAALVMALMSHAASAGARPAAVPTYEPSPDEIAQEMKDTQDYGFDYAIAPHEVATSTHKLTIYVNESSRPQMVIAQDETGAVLFSKICSTGLHQTVTDNSGNSYDASTVVGTYPIVSMQLHHLSGRYNVDMRHAMFFHGGTAIHGSSDVVNGSPASHGCVRLHQDDATTLYGIVTQFGRVNAQVIVQ